MHEHLVPSRTQAPSPLAFSLQLPSSQDSPSRIRHGQILRSQHSRACRSVETRTPGLRSLPSRLESREEGRGHEDPAGPDGPQDDRHDVTLCAPVSRPPRRSVGKARTKGHSPVVRPAIRWRVYQPPALPLRREPRALTTAGRTSDKPQMALGPELVVDADGHVCEPPDLWERNLPARFRDRALRLRWNAETGYDEAWVEGLAHHGSGAGRSRQRGHVVRRSRPRSPLRRR